MAAAIVEEYDVMISYPWNKEKDLVFRIASFLQEKGLKVWIDKEKLHCGENLFSEIADGIKHSKVIIPCISREYRASINCMREIKFATTNCSKKIVPLHLDNSKRDKDVDFLMGDLLYIKLCDRNEAVFMGNELDQKLKELYRSIKQHMKDQQGTDQTDEDQDRKHVNWSIHEGVVIVMELEEGDTGVSEVFYSDKKTKIKLKIDHKTTAQRGKPNYQTHNIESSIYLKIEKLNDGDYIIEIHTKCIYTFNVSVNSYFDNPAIKIKKIGIAIPCSNKKEYWEELSEAIFNPPIHEDRTVKFSYSNGASSTTQIQELKEFEEFAANYFKDNFMDQNLVAFPPFQTTIVNDDDDDIDKYQQTLVNCFITILKRRYTAERIGVVLVAPNVGHLSGIINNTGSPTNNINYCERKCLLVFVEEIPLVLVFGIAIEKSDLREEIANVQKDVQCFINIHSHKIKDGLTIVGIIACPSVERKEITNLIPFQFADVDIELYKTFFLCKDDIETERTFSKWWDKSISVLYRRLDIPDKASGEINFISIIGQHMVSMAIVTDFLPTLSCKTHDKLKTLILNKQQLQAIRSQSKRKHVVGPYGAGKSVVGQEILKNLMGKLKKNGELSTLFYITCESCSFIDRHVKSSVELLDDDKVKFVCGSLNELYRKCIDEQHPSSMSVSLDNLMKGLAENFSNPHFICDEVQSAVMTEHVAKTIDGYLKTILKQSNVVFIQQSMTKEREYLQHSIEADNFHHINGLELHRLQSVMRVSVEIQKLIFSAQEVIARHKLTVTVPNSERNVSNISLEPRITNPTTIDHTGKISVEINNSSKTVDEKVAKPIPKNSNSSFENLDAPIQIFSRSPQNRDVKYNITTKTTFFKGKKGHEISSKKPLLIFLPEANDVDTVKILSFVLNKQCIQKSPVFIANSLQSARLLNHGVKACLKETVVHIPSLQRRIPTTAEKDKAINKDADSNMLIIDHRSSLGMEYEFVVSIVDPAEEVICHSIVEIISRCTSYLSIFILPQKGETKPGSIGEIIDKWLEDNLVDKMFVKLEMDDDESMPFTMKDKNFIIYTKSDEFISLSDEIKCFSDDEFREHLPDEETSKDVYIWLREVENNKEGQSIIHEITWQGKKWSYYDVYRLLINKDYRNTFGKMFNHNRNILNYLRDEDNRTFLIHASITNRVDVVEHLTNEFKDEIDVLAVGKYGSNAYHSAAMYDSVDVMKHLLSCDRSGLDVADSDGDTPLHLAAMNAHKRVVNLLLDAGASVDVVEDGGRTPDRCTNDVEIKKIIQDHRTKSSS